MDCETGKDGTEILTAKKTATSRLVAILVMVAVMGISQSGIFLSLAKTGLELKDETLEFLIRELSYADDLHSGVTAQEVMDLQHEMFPTIQWQEMRRRCGDEACCPPSRTTAARPSPPPPPWGTATGGRAPASTSSQGLVSPQRRGLTPAPTTEETSSTTGWVSPPRGGLTPAPTAARATGVAMKGWQGGKVSAQGGQPPPPGGWAPPGADFKHAAHPKVRSHTHRVSAAVLDSMTTDSIMSALKVIMMENGYQTKHLSFDAGSSLIPAAERTAEAVEADYDEEEERETERKKMNWTQPPQLR